MNSLTWLEEWAKIEVISKFIAIGLLCVIIIALVIVFIITNAGGKKRK